MWHCCSHCVINIFVLLYHCLYNESIIVVIISICCAELQELAVEKQWVSAPVLFHFNLVMLIISPWYQFCHMDCESNHALCCTVILHSVTTQQVWCTVIFDLSTVACLKHLNKYEGHSVTYLNMIHHSYTNVLLFFSIISLEFYTLVWLWWEW